MNDELNRPPEPLPPKSGPWIYAAAVGITVVNLIALFLGGSRMDSDSLPVQIAVLTIIASLILGVVAVGIILATPQKHRAVKGIVYILPLIGLNFFLAIYAIACSLSGIRGWGGKGRPLRGKQSVWPMAHFTPSEKKIAPSGDTDLAYWNEMARDEYASISAFSRLSLQLQALNAPTELLRLTHRAASEEVKHTEICLEQLPGTSLSDLASAPLKKLGEDGLCHLGGEVSRLPAIVLKESLVDGFLNEGYNADLLLEQARSHPHADLCETFESIGSDEGAHADLAAKIVKWITGRYEFTATEISVIKAMIPIRIAASPVQRAYFDHYGLIPETERRQIFDRRRRQTLSLLET